MFFLNINKDNHSSLVITIFVHPDRWMDNERFSLSLERRRPRSSGQEFTSTQVHPREIPHGLLQ